MELVHQHWEACRDRFRELVAKAKEEGKESRAVGRDQLLGKRSRLEALEDMRQICQARGIPNVANVEPKRANVGLREKGARHDLETKIFVVRAVLVSGMTMTDAGKAYGVPISTVSIWCKA